MHIGQKLPNVTLPRDGGANVDLSKLAGKNVVLFFYPRDNTPGCTTESIEFSRMKDAFSDLNTVVYGVSKDSVASHDKFVAKRELTIPLLSDENHDLCETFGVWKEKNMYGKKFMGIERSTFLFNADGDLVNEWRKVKVADHVETVLQAVKDL
ncbi:alkyl hydroperoxide reductase [Amylibacter kogurei]|uniref:thioredoxin-dependent peroxiredoxin n=1 Tax=Paramylibacter kogurei TaxID=1889778 RepID=A0A2G5K7F2_9RHOB|nr:peroxiredoxin [Amylibacter kogurei]PIB24790.1 alkyl hydroperoxide reductase [Amylibacter kogurei]